MNEPIEVPMLSEHIATVRTLQEIVDLFRTMKERLGLTNDFCDDVGGLTKGHTDKILGRSEQKRLGYDTFALYTLLTAVEFRVYVDPDAVKRMEAVWEKRERPLFPHGKPGRISKKIIEAAKPLVLKERAQLGGMARARLLTSKQRSEIASKAAKAKHRKGRERKRAIARSKRHAKVSPTEPCVLDPRLSPSKHTICVSNAG